MIRIFVTADNLERVEALSALLEEDSRFEISSIERADVLLYLGIPRQRLHLHRKPIVAVSPTDDEDIAFGNDLKAWLPASAKLDEITAAVVAAAAGFTLLTTGQARRTFGPISPLEHSPLEPDQLTAREREVLQMMSTGFGNKEIAARLGISPNTVKFHVRQILAKLGVETRTQAVSTAIRRGLVTI